jgi:hypothetical protein
MLFTSANSGIMWSKRISFSSDDFRWEYFLKHFHQIIVKFPLALEILIELRVFQLVNFSNLYCSCSYLSGKSEDSLL